MRNHWHGTAQQSFASQGLQGFSPVNRETKKRNKSLTRFLKMRKIRIRFDDKWVGEATFFNNLSSNLCGHSQKMIYKVLNIIDC